MKNHKFDIEFNKFDGTIHSIKIVGDENDMNWCADIGKWGYVHCINYDNIWGDYKKRMKEMRLIDFMENDTETVSVYSNDSIKVTVKRFFLTIAENQHFLSIKIRDASSNSDGVSRFVFLFFRFICNICYEI